MAGKSFKVEARFVAKDQASPAIKKVGGSFSKLTTSIKSNALAIGASLAGIVVAFNQIKASAEELGQEQAFERGLARQGIAADQFIEKLKDISDNQIANKDLILATNRAIALGIQADDVPGLLDTAARASVELGISVTQAFNDITTGVGRASPLILDNLGIVVDSKRVYDEFAKSIGKTTEELTKQERTIALTKAVMETAIDTTEGFEKAQNSLTQSINQGAAAMSNLKSVLGVFAGGVLQGTASGIIGLTAILSLFVEAAVKALRGVVFLLRQIPFLGKAFDGVAGALERFDDGLDDSQKKMLKLATEMGKGFIAATKYSLGIRDAADAAKAAAPAISGFNETVEETGDNASTAAEDLATLTAVLSGSAVAADRDATAFERVAVALSAAVVQTEALTQAEQRRANLSSRPGLLDQPRGIGIEPGRFTGFTIPGGTFTTIKKVPVDENGNITG